jgi:hypothetical protein
MLAALQIKPHAFWSAASIAALVFFLSPGALVRSRPRLPAWRIRSILPPASM